MTNPNIKTDLTKLSSGKYCVTIHIDVDYVQLEASARLDKQTPNHTDMERIEATNEVLNDFIRSAFEEASIENKITPASAPDIELVSKNNENEYVFTATFDIVPHIDLTGLSNIAIEIPTVEVTASDLQSTIDAILKQSPSREAALASLGITETEFEAFKNEVLLNLQREAESYENEIKKHTVMTRVCDIFDITIPDSMVKPEIEKLIATEKESGNDALTAAELNAKATRNIQRRIVINAVVQETHLSLQPQTVRKRVESVATAYENPEEVVQWYYSNRIELAGIEAKVIEELVIDWIINACNQTSYKMSFSEAANKLSQY